MTKLNKDYARIKLELLLRDLDHYNADEFWRQMSRIAGGATGLDHAEVLADKLNKADVMLAEIELKLDQVLELAEKWVKEEGVNNDFECPAMDGNMCADELKKVLEEKTEKNADSGLRFDYRT